MENFEVILLKDKAGLFNIVRSGQSLKCPFRAPIVVQNSLGQPTYAEYNCGSWCPHFQIWEGEISLSCGSGANIRYSKTEEVKEETKTNSRIIL
jgi:hypothetical protein